jgi:vacuolar protein sorting-associated protein 41
VYELGSSINFELRTLVQAVEFVMEQDDDELWEEMIKQCLQKPEMVIETNYA